MPSDASSLFLRARSRWPVVLAVLLILVLGSSAGAAPILGVYQSDDMDGGTFLTGRWSEGYVAGDPDHVGNGAHSGSWDSGASTLYSQWELAGPTLAGTTTDDYRVGGNGVVIYFRTFDTSSASLTLKAFAGSLWTGLGDSDYTVDLNYYTQTVMVLYRNGLPVFANSLETFHGDFVGYAGYELSGQASGAFVGQGVGSPPLNYPAWIPGTVVSGAWGDVGLIQFDVTPEPATLALVGVGLAAIWSRRRKA